MRDWAHRQAKSPLTTNVAHAHSCHSPIPPFPTLQCPIDPGHCHFLAAFPAGRCMCFIPHGNRIANCSPALLSWYRVDRGGASPTRLTAAYPKSCLTYFAVCNALMVCADNERGSRGRNTFIVDYDWHLRTHCALQSLTKRLMPAAALSC